MLRFVTYFFVQNSESTELLRKIGIENAQVTGDTRFDRVLEIADRAKELPLIDYFKNRKKTLIAGSTWPADLEVLCEFHKKYRSWKLILAPHDITGKSISETLKKFPDAELYSNLKNRSNNLELIDNRKKVLIIDNVGMLSSVYRYADVCYIGGGFGAGIHNVLEAAVYGRAVLFGPKYKKFQEAKDMVSQVIAFPVQDGKEFIGAMEGLMDEDFRMNVNDLARTFVYSRAGATASIINYLKSISR